MISATGSFFSAACVDERARRMLRGVGGADQCRVAKDVNFGVEVGDAENADAPLQECDQIVRTSEAALHGILARVNDELTSLS
jgi:hypothetical protein